MNNLEKETKISKKNAWVFGTVSIILAIVSSQIFEKFIHCNANKSWSGWILLYFLGIAIIGIWGLVKGVKELKYSKNTAGVIGIIVSILGIVLSLLLGYGAELTIFVCTN